MRDRIEVSENTGAADRDTLLLFGGLALIVMGAGMILSNATVRRQLGQFGAGNLLQAGLPDFQRYLKLRSM